MAWLAWWWSAMPYVDALGCTISIWNVIRLRRYWRVIPGLRILLWQLIFVNIWFFSIDMWTHTTLFALDTPATVRFFSIRLVLCVFQLWFAWQFWHGRRGAHR